jgi:hypothetical protein
VMQWMQSCLVPPITLSWSVWEVMRQTSNWQLKIGGSVMSWYTLLVTLSRNG